MDAMIVTIGILLYATIFILGFIVGRVTKNASIEQVYESIGNNAVLKPKAEQRKVVRIDDKKFVTSVSTESLQKKGKDLGTQVVVEDDVENAVSKLTLLKKK